MNWSDYPNFSAQEFDCTHCGANEMKPEFMAKLQQLRTVYGAPMPVSYTHLTLPTKLEV